MATTLSVNCRMNDRSTKRLSIYADNRRPTKLPDIIPTMTWDLSTPEDHGEYKDHGDLTLDQLKTATTLAPELYPFVELLKELKRVFSPTMVNWRLTTIHIVEFSVKTTGYQFFFFREEENVRIHKDNDICSYGLLRDWDASTLIDNYELWMMRAATMDNVDDSQNPSQDYSDSHWRNYIAKAYDNLFV